MNRIVLNTNPVGCPTLTEQQRKAYNLLLTDCKPSRLRERLSLQSNLPVLSILGHLEDKGYLKILVA